MSSRFALVLLFALVTHAAMAAEPFEGTWKLVPEQSRLGVEATAIVMTITGRSQTSGMARSTEKIVSVVT
jgi:hypothetical protein